MEDEGLDADNFTVEPMNSHWQFNTILILLLLNYYYYLIASFISNQIFKNQNKQIHTTKAASLEQEYIYKLQENCLSRKEEVAFYRLHIGRTRI